MEIQIVETSIVVRPLKDMSAAERNAEYASTQSSIKLGIDFFDDIEHLVQQEIHWQSVQARSNIKEILVRNFIDFGQLYIAPISPAHDNNSNLNNSNHIPKLVVPIISNQKTDIHVSALYRIISLIDRSNPNYRRASPLDIQLDIEKENTHSYRPFTSAENQEIFIQSLVLQPSDKPSLRNMFELQCGYYSYPEVMSVVWPNFIELVDKVTKITGSEIEFIKKLTEIYLSFFSQPAATYLSNIIPKLFKVSPRALTIPDKEIGEKGREKIATTKRYEKIEPFLNQVYSLLGIVSPSGLSPYRDASLYSLYKTNILPYAYILGVDDEETQKRFDVLSTTARRKQMYSDIEKATITKYNLKASYEYIIEKKFGKQAMTKIIQKLAGKINITAEDLLSALPAADAKIVRAEYERKLAYYDAVINNSCPHVELYKSLRRMKNPEKAKEILAELMKYSDKKPAKDALHECSKCSFPLICPHVVDLISLGSSNFTEIRKVLYKYIEDNNKENKKDTSEKNPNSYCYVCGEIVASVYEVSTMDNDDISIDPMLQSDIFGAAMNTLKSFSFNSLVNKTELVSGLIRHIGEFIADIEIELIKSKTSSLEDIKNWKKLFIYIYCYAYMVHLMYCNKTSDISLGKVRADSDIKVLLVAAIKDLYSSKASLIAKIPGVSLEFIKNKLTPAYNWIARKGEQVVRLGETTDDTETTLNIDPVFLYLLSMHRIYGKSSTVMSDILQLPNSKVKVKVKDQGDKRRPKNLESDGDIFTNVKLPPTDSQAIASFEKLASAKNPTQSFYESIDNGNNRKLLNTYRTGLSQASFQQFWSKISSLIYKSPIYANRILTEKYETETINYHRLRQSERIFSSWNIIKNTSPLHYDNMTNAYTQFMPVAINMSRIRDAEGRKHVFNKYVYEDGEKKKRGEGEKREEKKKEELILTEQDITKMLASGSRLTATIIDRVCSVCGVRESDAGKQDEESIIQSIAEKTNRQNFNNYYINRCPENLIHKFVNDKCEYCSVQRSKTDDSYYEKYKEQFLQESQKAVSYRATKMNEAESGLSDETKTTLDGFLTNHKIILDLCSKLKINPNLITSLGATFNKPIEEILSGLFVPTPAEHTSDPRISALDSYIRGSHMLYNQLRNYGRIFKPPQILTDIITAGNIRTFEYSKLPEMLPAIDQMTSTSQYNEKFHYMKKFIKPKVITDWLLFVLCSSMLEIIQSGKLGQLFVESCMQDIVHKTKMLSKPGEFDIKLIRKPDQKIGQEYDPNLDADRGLEEVKDKFETDTDKNDKDDDEEDEEDEDSGSTDKPFKNNFDTENADEDEENIEDSMIGDNIESV